MCYVLCAVYHRIPLGCSCLMTTTLPEAILPFTANTVLWGKGCWVSDYQATILLYSIFVTKQPT